MIILIILGVYLLVAFIVSLILARFNSKLYTYLEDEVLYIKTSYEDIELLGLSLLWPLFPLFFIVLGWDMLLNKISKKFN